MIIKKLIEMESKDSHTTSYRAFTAHNQANDSTPKTERCCEKFQKLPNVAQLTIIAAAILGVIMVGGIVLGEGLKTEPEITPAPALPTKYLLAPVTKPVFTKPAF